MVASQNGWRANDPSVITSINVPGGKLTCRKGSVAVIFQHLVNRFHNEVEALVWPGNWGYAERDVRGSTDISNHASGTAIDLNAPRHVLGALASASFSAAQINKIHEILSFYEGVIRWGGDYTGRKDSMHFEVNDGVDQAALDRIAAKCSAPVGFPIIGNIGIAYNRPGNAAVLGAPLMAEGSTSGTDKAGRWQVFSGGFIFWHPNVDKGNAHVVSGDIGKLWTKLGREVLTGFPTTDEMTTPDKRGRYNHFAGGMSIYWTLATGAHLVRGAIRDKWATLGWETKLGYPTTDEMTTPDKVGRYNHFTGGAVGVGDASIYYHPQAGTWAIYGDIRKAWAAQGWETGKLGYPTSDEHAAEGGVVQSFQGGSILWVAGKTTVRLNP